MKTRLYHTMQGVLIGAILTAGVLGFAYLQTHTIKFSSMASNQPMETMEAEHDLPPMMQLAFRQNPRALAEWKRMSQSHRRAHLFAIFHYRTPEARANRITKCMKEMLERAEKSGSAPRKSWP